MASPINKQTLERLAELARVKLQPQEEERLLNDLKKILGHFEELEELDTSNIAPMTGGTELKNIFREDEERMSTNRGQGTDQFPESKEGFLNIPPVFE